MDEKESINNDAGGGITVIVALNGGSKSKHVVKWALEKFIPEGKVKFKLLHVLPRITSVPTPMGNLIPLPQVREDVATAFKKEVEWQKTEMLKPYQKICAYKKVQAEIMLIESDEVANAISAEITKNTIKDLVVGASSNSIFSKKYKGQTLSSIISECAPSFCTVYVVSKGKLESLRPSEAEANATSTTLDYSSASGDSSGSSSRYSSSTLDPGSSASDSPYASPLPQKKRLETAGNYSQLPQKRLEPLPEIRHSTINVLRRESSTDHGNRLKRYMDMKEQDDNEMSTYHSAAGSGMGCFGTTSRDTGSSIRSSFVDSGEMWMTNMHGATSSSSNIISFDNKMHVNMELERLRIELRHIRGMYAIAQNETIDATRKLSDLSKLRLDEALKLKEINDKEEKAKELARLEKEKAEAANKEAEYARQAAHREAYQRREAEILASQQVKEREKLKTVLGGPVRQYEKFSWEEIVAATSNFNEDLNIGMGSYGTVYKCKLHHTNVAIKVLHSTEGSQSKQFQQELQILSSIRHPHLLMLLGACPEEGCLVYEYMENGSLDERLRRHNNTPPIPWYDRFRIAWEVASALAFLHNTKPKPIIHRDLKPANILLDQNFVSKIGDAGLCTMLNIEPSTTTMAGRTVYKDTSPVGTLCYIDPEYQRTGLISTKSDVYALGMVILQLLTARPPVGIAHLVEGAIDEGKLMQMLDEDAGKWPVRETTEMALLGLQCAELRGRDRPDLKDKVLPALQRLKDAADQARDSATNGPMAPPTHFLCPILKDLMEDPCVAADGYTYDRKAIEMWLKDNDTSPTTNFPLSSKNLIPNFTLQYAIMDWKTRRKSPRGSLRSK